MRGITQRIILLLALFTLTACGNKVAVQHPDNQPSFSYPAIEEVEERELQFPVTIDEDRQSDEASE